MLKKFTYLIFSFTIIFLCIFSCNENDGYSLGDFQVDIVTVHQNGIGLSFFTDNGLLLWPAAGIKDENLDKGKRYFLNYTILSDKQNEYDHYIKVNDLWEILTKDIIFLSAQNADSIGNDPVKVNKLWIAGDYLNVDFSFNYSGNVPNFVNMVQLANDNSKSLTLEFRHNSHGSQQKNLIQGFVSFDLKKFQNGTQNALPITVNVKDFDGLKKYDLVYKYNQPLLSKADSSVIPILMSNEYK